MLDGQATANGQDARQQHLQAMGLDAAAIATLRAMGPVLEQAAPAAIDALYRQIAQWPAVATMVEGQQSRLKQAQAEHWRKLFSGDFSESYFAHARHVGSVHEKIGLDPLWHVGGYGVILDRFFDVMVDKAPRDQLKAWLSTLVRTVLLDLILGISAYNKASGQGQVERELQTLSEILGREVELTLGEISAQAALLTDRAADLNHIALELSHTSESVAQSVRVTDGNVGVVAGATVELEASSREISSQVRQTSSLVDKAEDQMNQTRETVSGLGEATQEIDGVVRLIRGIAGQTRMLALNATIEAARAGEAGKGFAVVADEVKGLARQTDQGISGISESSARIGHATHSVVTMVEQSADAMHAISDIAGQVAAAAAEQMSATAEIMRSATEASAHVRELAQYADVVQRQAHQTEENAGGVERMSGQVSSHVTDLQDRLGALLSRGVAQAGDRARQPVALHARLTLGGQAAEGYVIDLSGVSALMAVQLPIGLIDSGGALDIDGVGSIAVRLSAVTNLGCHLQFLSMNQTQSGALLAMLREARDEMSHYGGIASQVASQVSAAMESALQRGEISKDDLFDSTYQPIPDSNPAQVICRHALFTDRILPPIMEPVLTRDSRVVFCLAADRNGYIATHNQKYSHPQRPGDVAWNTANCRNRRVFDDRTGILAARNHRSIFLQTYARKMTETETVMLKELNSPIMAGGLHWGNVRLAILPLRR